LVDIPGIFALTGLIIGIGFISDLIFDRTGIPDALILIFLGMYVGPLLHIVESEALRSVTPIFAPLAITIILFEAGLNLRLRTVISQSLPALFLAALGVLGSIFVTAIFTILYLQWPLLESMLLGAILGGTSSAVIIPIVAKANISPKISTILSLESAFTDAMIVVVAIALLQLVAAPASNAQPSMLIRGIASGFSVGGVTGFITGLIWLRMIRVFAQEANRDVLTLGMALLTYGVSEGMGGNGAISALVFGLVLGNGVEISMMLGLKEPVEATTVMKRFQAQISFLIRTFFFTYLGIIFAFREPNIILSGVIISFLLFAVRYLIVQFSSIAIPILKLDTLLISMMLGRGLAAAVLANLSTFYGLALGETFQDITLMVIIVTVGISVLGAQIPNIRSMLSPQTEK